MQTYALFPTERWPISRTILAVTIATRTCVIIAECLAAGATWLALSGRYDFGHAGALKGTISQVLLLDGETKIGRAHV